MEQNYRLLLAVALSTLILFIWQIYYLPPIPEAKKATALIASDTKLASVEESYKLLPRNELIEKGYKTHNRIKINNKFIDGSINLQGARIDDIRLAQYKEKIGGYSDNVILLSPSYTKELYFAEFGWVNASDTPVDLPNSQTIWKADNEPLQINEATNLFWTNDQGIKFIINISLDNHYMFKVSQSVENNSNTTITLKPYALLNRSKGNEGSSNMIIHEGAIGVFDDKLKEITFEDLADDKNIEFNNTRGWFGFSDKYWLTALIPDTDSQFDSRFSYFKSNNSIRYQVDSTGASISVEPKKTIHTCIKLFAGAKNLDLLDKYQLQYNINLFDRAVDFGLLYFITKPIFLLLNYFYQLIGNFGLAILLLTIIIKILLFPLAYKGFSSMNKIKVLQPQMGQLKEVHKDNAVAFQKAVLELYKKEKVNPMSGCLPIVLQMPVFFALYKVLYVTIEMRHAYFFGWIKDLSAPDPTSFFNLFGLLPWNTPVFLTIGALPLLMAFTMFIQQSLNPEPADPTQAKVMKFLPVIFLFMFSSFPSGLVLYWAWSNILSIAQQLIIKKIVH